MEIGATRGLNRIVWNFCPGPCDPQPRAGAALCSPGA